MRSFFSLEFEPVPVGIAIAVSLVYSLTLIITWYLAVALYSLTRPDRIEQIEQVFA